MATTFSSQQPDLVIQDAVLRGTAGVNKAEGQLYDNGNPKDIRWYPVRFAHPVTGEIVDSLAKYVVRAYDGSERALLEKGEKVALAVNKFPDKNGKMCAWLTIMPNGALTIGEDLLAALGI